MTDSTDPVWRRVAEEAADGLFLCDASLRILWVNRRACELLERTLHELVGMRIADYFYDATELERAPLRKADLVAGVATITERTFRTGSGARLVLEVSAKKVGEGLILGIARDATARLDAVGRLERSEASFRALIEGSPDGIVVHTGGVTRYANTAMAKILGFDSPQELVGTKIIELVHPDDRATVTERVRSLQSGAATVPFAEERLLKRDGSVVFASIEGLGVVYEGQPAVAAIVRDVTEQRAMRAQLAHTEKMASLGVLSAGVAHEINNPLAFITLCLDAIAALTIKLEEGVIRTRQQIALRHDEVTTAQLVDPTLAHESFARLAEHTATAKSGAERVSSIVSDLRVFSRSDDDVRARIDVRVPLSRALSMVGHELRHKARVIVDETATPPVLANEGRLSQVFVNLLLNAGHAVAEKSADTANNEIRIRIALEGGEVRVSIADNGVGVPAENLPRLFEPFFTTKPVGVGTGLGLSICHGIVTSLGGVIRVESREGAGTTFTVAIPPAPGEAE